FEQLVPFDHWRGAFVFLLGSLVASFFMFGLWWLYWRRFDMDFLMVYEAWLYNDGLPQGWFHHAGYLTILLLGNWFRLLHAVGLLDIHALSLLPAPAEAAPGWTQAVRAGRVLSLLLACAFVGTFALLLRRLIENWRVAALGAFALTFSAGVMMQSRSMRTELIAAGLAVTALLILLIAARTPPPPLRPGLLGLHRLL